MTPCEMIHVRHSDGYETLARLWMPSEPRVAVLYLHGIQSHGLWFERSAVRLAESNCAVLLPDRRGSGRNKTDRGHAASPRRLLRDAGDWLDELHLRTGFDRFHIVGVSWGGKLALAVQRHAPSRIAGLTLVAPGLFPQMDMSFSEKLRVGLAAVAAPRRLFPIPLDNVALFTDNIDRQAFIGQDTLRLCRVTAAFLITSRRLDRYARGAVGDSKGCPLSVFLADRDRIIDNEKTREFIRKLRWPRCAIVEFQTAAHTLEFESDPKAFLEELVRSVTDGSEPRR